MKQKTSTEIAERPADSTVQRDVLTFSREIIMSRGSHKVVIVGAGFAGLNAAKKLGKRRDIDVTLLDRRNHHLFQPLLYQVALAGLSPAEIAVPIRQILASYRNVRVLMESVTSIDFTARRVRSENHEYDYDYLVLACGASHSYFGKDQWEDYAPGIKTLEQATEIRRRILTAFERAELETDKELQGHFLTFAVVGGGPTGVELAGAIAEISHKTLTRDFKTIDPGRTRVILVEAGPRILPGFSEYLSRRATIDLENMGVCVWVNSLVTGIDEQGLHIGNEFLAAANVVWAAGVKPAPICEELPFAKDGSGRIVVDEYLNCNGYSQVFVIGDMAHTRDVAGKVLPGIAPVAMQQGHYVAKEILHEIDGKQKTKFSYHDKGMMATIGRKRAVASVGKFQFTGTFAWIAWLVVHIYYLIGFRNKVFVLINWAWSYVSYKKSARLILSKDWRERS